MGDSIKEWETILKGKENEILMMLAHLQKLLRLRNWNSRMHGHSSVPASMYDLHEDKKFRIGDYRVTFEDGETYLLKISF